MPTNKSADSLAVPVLTVSRQGEMDVVDNPDTLQTGNALAIRNGFFDGQMIIEWSGESYRVAAVKKRAAKGRWWGFRFLKPRLYSVELTLTLERRRTLQEIQDLAVRNVRRHPDIWQGAWDVAELEERIRTTTDLKQLFAVLHD